MYQAWMGAYLQDASGLQHALLTMQTKIGGVSLAGKILVFQDIEFQLISLNKAMDSMIASAKKSEGRV